MPGASAFSSAFSIRNGNRFGNLEIIDYTIYEQHGVGYHNYQYPITIKLRSSTGVVKISDFTSNFDISPKLLTHRGTTYYCSLNNINGDILEIKFRGSATPN